MKKLATIKMRGAVVEVELDVTKGEDVVSLGTMQANAIIAAFEQGSIKVDITDWDHNVVELPRTIQ